MGTFLRYCSFECARGGGGNAANDQYSTSARADNTRLATGNVLFLCKVLTGTFVGNSYLWKTEILRT